MHLLVFLPASLQGSPSAGNVIPQRVLQVMLCSAAIILRRSVTTHFRFRRMVAMVGEGDGENDGDDGAGSKGSGCKRWQ